MQATSQRRVSSASISTVGVSLVDYPNSDEEGINGHDKSHHQQHAEKDSTGHGGPRGSISAHQGAATAVQGHLGTQAQQQAWRNAQQVGQPPQPQLTMLTLDQQHPQFRTMEGPGATHAQGHCPGHGVGCGDAGAWPPSPPATAHAAPRPQQQPQFDVRRAPGSRDWRQQEARPQASVTGPMPRPQVSPVRGSTQHPCQYQQQRRQTQQPPPPQHQQHWHHGPREGHVESPHRQQHPQPHLTRSASEPLPPPVRGQHHIVHDPFTAAISAAAAPPVANPPPQQVWALHLSHPSPQQPLPYGQPYDSPRGQLPSSHAPHATPQSLPQPQSQWALHLAQPSPPTGYVAPTSTGFGAPGTQVMALGHQAPAYQGYDPRQAYPHPVYDPQQAYTQQGYDPRLAYPSQGYDTQHGRVQQGYHPQQTYAAQGHGQADYGQQGRAPGPWPQQGNGAGGPPGLEACDDQPIITEAEARASFGLGPGYRPGPAAGPGPPKDPVSGAGGRGLRVHGPQGRNGRGVHGDGNANGEAAARPRAGKGGDSVGGGGGGDQQGQQGVVSRGKVEQVDQEGGGWTGWKGPSTEAAPGVGQGVQQGPPPPPPPQPQLQPQLRRDPRNQVPAGGQTRDGAGPNGEEARDSGAGDGGAGGGSRQASGSTAEAAVAQVVSGQTESGCADVRGREGGRESAARGAGGQGADQPRVAQAAGAVPPGLAEEDGGRHGCGQVVETQGAAGGGLEGEVLLGGGGGGGSKGTPGEERGQGPPGVNEGTRDVLNERVVAAMEKAAMEAAQGAEAGRWAAGESREGGGTAPQPGPGPKLQRLGTVGPSLPSAGEGAPLSGQEGGAGAKGLDSAHGAGVCDTGSRGPHGAVACASWRSLKVVHGAHTPHTAVACGSWRSLAAVQGPHGPHSAVAGAGAGAGREAPGAAAAAAGPEEARGEGGAVPGGAGGCGVWSRGYGVLVCGWCAGCCTTKHVYTCNDVLAFRLRHSLVRVLSGRDRCRMAARNTRTRTAACRTAAYS